MNSVDETKSDTQGFSKTPFYHYMTTILIVLFALDIYWSIHSFYCLSDGNDYECKFDVNRLRELGMRVSDSQFDLISQSLQITLIYNLVQLPLIIIAFSPVYSIAFYINGFYRLRRDLVGVIFWIIAWALAALTLPLASIVAFMFDPGHVSWRADLFNLFVFGVAGVACGVVYCLLVFRDRGTLSPTNFCIAPPRSPPDK